jgi:hypothetical protein
MTDHPHETGPQDFTSAGDLATGSIGSRSQPRLGREI